MAVPHRQQSSLNVDVRHQATNRDLEEMMRNQTFREDLTIVFR
jgi:transcriptional regulator with GAF, ATPase, and Fis domain